MNQHIGNIIDTAKKLGEESDKQIEQYCKWEDYILPLIEKEFKIRNFPLSFRGRAKREIQDFINKKEIEFNKTK